MLIRQSNPGCSSFISKFSGDPPIRKFFTFSDTDQNSVSDIKRTVLPTTSHIPHYV